MGAYLNRPIIEKEKEEGTGDGLSYACTTMQGWRANQEDAHNCVVDLHTGWHMFAVYDGHGGTEVSKFTSAKLPDFLKERKFWEADDITDCLQKAFVDFDDFIRAEDSMKEMKEISNKETGKKSPGNDSEDEADRIGTIEESSMPLADLIRRYGAVGGGGLGKSLLSAFLAKGDASDSDDEDEEEEEDEEVEEDDEEGEKKGGEQKEDGQDDEVAEETDDEKEEEKEVDVEKDGKETEENAADKKKKVHKRCSKSPIQSEAKKSKSEESSAEAPASSSSNAAAENVTEEDDDDSDKEFVADEEEEVDEEQSDEDEEFEEADFGQLMLKGAGGAEVPGEDSGTTACVCLLSNDKIIVANAGDSRAILCRAGKAVDLSVDHKPEDEVETNRIHAAGGTIEDGRVNGGLNLSRALGDHAYKKNRDLELKEQMITAHPDVKIETLTPEDEFLIVACDGIWNSMESQQVVDFVRDLLAKGKTCAEVCDALCDECLADSTEGDGTGCDNMTVICTTFKR